MADLIEYRLDDGTFILVEVEEASEGGLQPASDESGAVGRAEKTFSD